MTLLLRAGSVSCFSVCSLQVLGTGSGLILWQCPCSLPGPEFLAESNCFRSAKSRASSLIVGVRGFIFQRFLEPLIPMH